MKANAMNAAEPSRRPGAPPPVGDAIITPDGSAVVTAAEQGKTQRRHLVRIEV